MASLPAVRTTESPEPTREQLQRMAIAEALAAGKTPAEIAKRLAPKDLERRKVWRQKIRRWAYTDPEFGGYTVAAAQGELLLGLGRATQGLIRRAARGNVPAVKLLFEATNFHNPKVKHEHSGEVKVKLEVGGQVSSAPRPAPVEDVIDAEVVE